MATAYGLSSWTSSIALESELSRNLEAQHGLVPKLSHHGGKNSENREQSQTCLSYAEVHPVFAGTANTPRVALKNLVT